MRWGLFYLPTSLPDTPQQGADRYRTIIEQVRYAEEIGFDSAWLAEHHFQAFGGMFPSTPLIGAAIAQRTKTIRIGTAVVLLPYHNPIRIAEDYATLDLLSHGRLEFGVGHGFVKWEALKFGIPLEELRERFRENLEVVLKAWTQPTMNHKGRFYEYNDLAVWPRPLQQPHPTVWMAATASIESFEFSGQQGYHMMLIPFLHDVEDLRPKVEAYLAARQAAGHDPSTARILAVYHLYVGEDAAEARSSGSAGVLEYMRVAGSAHSLTPNVEEPESYRGHLAHRAAIRTLGFDDLLQRNRVLIGSAGELREQLRYLRDQLHLTDVAGLCALGGLTDAQARASMRRFIKDVAPYVNRDMTQPASKPGTPPHAAEVTGPDHQPKA